MPSGAGGVKAVRSLERLSASSDTVRYVSAKGPWDAAHVAVASLVGWSKVWPLACWRAPRQSTRAERKSTLRQGSATSQGGVESLARLSLRGGRTSTGTGGIALSPYRLAPRASRLGSWVCLQACRPDTHRRLLALRVHAQWARRGRAGVSSDASHLDALLSPRSSP